MSRSIPISELRNYGPVLGKVYPGTPVYLSKNGREVFSIRSIEDEEKFIRAEAMIHLLCELNLGVKVAEEEGWITEEEVRAHIKDRRTKE